MSQATALFPTSAGILSRKEHPEHTSAVVRHLSHELRQPLSTIEASAYYLRLILADSEPRVIENLDKIQQMVDQLSWILSDAIHFTQAARPHQSWIDLTEILIDCVYAMGMNQSVTVDWNPDIAPPLVQMDVGQAQHMARSLLQVFRLLSNDGRVRLSLRRSGGRAILECSCVPAEGLDGCDDDLFEPFTPHLPAGSGLSLASVRRIAEAHRGRARMERSANRLLIEVELPECSARS